MQKKGFLVFFAAQKNQQKGKDSKEREVSMTSFRAISRMEKMEKNERLTLSIKFMAIK